VSVRIYYVVRRDIWKNDLCASNLTSKSVSMYTWRNIRVPSRSDLCSYAVLCNFRYCNYAENENYAPDRYKRRTHRILIPLTVARRPSCGAVLSQWLKLDDSTLSQTPELSAIIPWTFSHYLGHFRKHSSWPSRPTNTKSLHGFASLLLNVFKEYFQREDFVLFPCHLEVLGLVSSCMFAIVHINLEQAFCWVTY
jgi:hypothetical protein